MQIVLDFLSLKKGLAAFSSYSCVDQASETRAAKPHGLKHRK
jgi:hypothetical protein